MLSDGMLENEAVELAVLADAVLADAVLVPAHPVKMPHAKAAEIKIAISCFFIDSSSHRTFRWCIE